MNSRAASSAGAAWLDADAAQSGSVVVRDLDPALLDRLRAAVDSGLDACRVLWTTVVHDGRTTAAADLPKIAGTCAILERDIVFTPCFPFEPGVRYRAVFDPQEIDEDGHDATLTLAFSPPAAPARPPVVLGIFPAVDTLPDNVLRLYVLFSEPMQRSFAEREIGVATADGRIAPDVLYRAPVELWDSSMRCLTVLLDPGRLKRGVGPNRALGPPLAEGGEYVLSIGAGMTGASGMALGGHTRKYFRAGSAVREPVAVDSWNAAAPGAGTRDALMLAFPRALDWAMLHHALDITLDGATIDGEVDVGAGATAWRFTPDAPWAPGRYRIGVDADLEDACGNDMAGAFDRALRAAPGPGLDGAGAALIVEVKGP